MKKLFPFLCLLLITCSLSAQTQVASKTIPPVLDKSPMDMVYYPANYPVLKIQEKVTEPLLARVIYSRPQKNDRTIFGDLIEYNSIWRLGANEATEIELFKDVKINGKKLLKGRYTLYAIPTPSSSWIINSMIPMTGTVFITGAIITILQNTVCLLFFIMTECWDRITTSQLTRLIK